MKSAIFKLIEKFGVRIIAFSGIAYLLFLVGLSAGVDIIMLALLMSVLLCKVLSDGINLDFQVAVLSILFTSVHLLIFFKCSPELKLLVFHCLSFALILDVYYKFTVNRQSDEKETK